MEESGSSTQISSVTYGYDALGRVSYETDARNGTTYYTYNSQGQVTRVDYPSGGPVVPSHSEMEYEDNTGLLISETMPDGGVKRYKYNKKGEKVFEYGTRTNPVKYEYDAQGRMIKMWTYKDFSGDPDSPGTGALTQWTYNQYTGSLKEKTDADSQDTVYAYTDGGRIDTKTQANGAVTENVYDFESPGSTSWKGGYLLKMDYSGTPGGDDVSFYSGTTLGYDRLGRNTFSEKNSMETTRTYNLLSLLESESYSGTGAVLENYSVEYDYDDYGRRTRVEVKENTTSKNKITYGYDADTGRRAWITNGVYKAKYGYDSNSSLISSIEFYNGSTRKMTSLKDYDFLNRTVSVDSEIESSGKHIGFGYQYNLASQRTQISREDGSHWKYGYDSLGQVISGQRYWGDGTRVIGQQFGYDYDDIGNRIHSYAGGDADGSNMRTTDYTHNDVNEMTERDLSGYVEIQGIAPLSSVVSVNSQAADRQGECYRKELSVSTTSAAAYTDVTVSGTGLTSRAGKVFTPKDSDILTYDASGNLTQDGRWDYIWDGENRLVEMTVKTNLSLTFTNFPAYKLEFEYDVQGRRIEKKVYDDDSSVIEHKKFVYDGWNLLMEEDALNSSNNVTYTWGLDLSGTDQGAGGVGGLLMIHDSSTHFVAMDGNGNVAALTDGTEVTGQYEYDPFGNLLRVTGSAGVENPFRFSTKYWDEETGLVYYGFRYYSPVLGRWVNRDPIGEEGGLPLYLFKQNDLINNIDIFGLYGAMPGYGPGWDEFDWSWEKSIIDYSEGGTKCRTNKQSKVPSYNGCGAAGSLIPVPDSHLYVSFTPACNKHDICWGVCGSSKKKCDKEFRDDLFELCDDRYGKWNFVALALCRSQAHFYYIAVVEGGEGAFESAQNEHCVWEECCEID